MFDFPASPSVGATYQVGGKVYVYDGEKWRNAPSSMPPAKTAQRRNRVVNPAMQHSQENSINSSAASATGTWWEADQWIASWNMATASLQAGLVSVAAADAPASPLAATLYCATAKAALGAGDYQTLRQTFEGTVVQDFQWGTPKALPAVLTFYAKHHVAGNYSVRIANPTEAFSFVKTFALEADKWTKIVVPIPAMTSGTWPLFTTAAGMFLDFTNAIGSSYIGVEGWQSGNRYAGPTQSNGCAVANKSLSVTDVGLYLDPDNTGLAPPFEVPDYADELRRCKRYFQAGQFLLRGSAMAGGVGRAGCHLPVDMRIAPTVSKYGSISMYSPPLGQATITSLGTAYTTTTGIEFDLVVGAWGSGTPAGQAAMLFNGQAGGLYLNARM